MERITPAEQIDFAHNKRLLNRYRFIEYEMLRILAGWLPATARMERKLAIGRLLWEDAQHVQHLYQRLREIQTPAFRDPDDPALLRLMAEAIHAPCEGDLLAGLLRVVKPALAQAYAWHMDQTFANPDAPTLYALRHILLDEREHLGLAHELLVDHPAGPWEAYIAGLLAAAGGVSGREERGAEPAPPACRAPFVAPRQAARDGRFSLVSYRDSSPAREEDKHNFGEGQALPEPLRTRGEGSAEEGQALPEPLRTRGEGSAEEGQALPEPLGTRGEESAEEGQALPEPLGTRGEGSAEEGQALPEPPPIKDERLAEFESYSQEMLAAETVALVLYLSPGMPWEFVYNSARHCYDETRHCKLGIDWMVRHGIDYTAVPQNTRIYAWRSQYDPATQYCMLTMGNEQHVFPYRRKRLEGYRAAGDRLSAQFLSYDIADERQHVAYGRKWLPQLMAQHGIEGPVAQFIDATVARWEAEYRSGALPIHAAGA